MDLKKGILIKDLKSALIKDFGKGTLNLLAPIPDKEKKLT